MNNTYWKNVSKDCPPYNTLLLVFRAKRKKYTVVRCHQSTDPDLDEWVTEHGSCLPVDPQDLWLDFPYVKIETLYD